MAGLVEGCIGECISGCCQFWCGPCIKDCCIKTPAAVQSFLLGVTLLVIGILALYSVIENFSPALAYGLLIAPGIIFVLLTSLFSKYGI